MYTYKTHQGIDLIFVQFTVSFIVCGKENNRSSRDVHNLIFGICEYVILLGKIYFCRSN